MATATTLQQAPRSIVEETTTVSGGTAKKEKLGGVSWWLVLGSMICADLLSALISLLVDFGIGLSATVLGAVVGIPIAVLGWGLDMTVTLFALMTSCYFYWVNGVSLMGARNLVTGCLDVIIEMVPIIDILPTATISFLIVSVFENAERSGGALGSAVKLAKSNLPTKA